MSAANLPQLLRQQAERHPDKPAIRHQADAASRELSYADYRVAALRCAARLVALGVRPGDRVGILSENGPGWLIADQGILAAGAVTVGLHAGLPADAVADQLAHAGVRVLLASAREQRETVPGLRRRLPVLADVLPLPFDGGGASAAELAEVGRRIDAVGPSDLATIVYTSGTTGSPKGVMLTHGNLMSNVAAAEEVLPFGPDAVMLSWLPFSHIYARCSDAYRCVYAGCTLALARSPETVAEDLRAVRPTFTRGVPRFYEKMLRRAEEGASSEEEVGERLRDLFGGRVRWLFVGGAPLPARVAEAYRRAGLWLLQGYGLTETSPTATVNRPDRFRAGTAGVPLPGCEVRIAADGEVLIRGPNVSPGYWNDAAATAETIRDGWLHTGDLGAIDSGGFLTITGRKKELIVLSTGRKVVPTRVEELLRADPWVEQAVVVGDGRPHLVALVVPTPAARREELGERIAKAQSGLAPWEQVKRFALLDRPLSVAAGELTVNLKLRREVIRQRYAKEIAALYEEPSPRTHRAKA